MIRTALITALALVSLAGAAGAWFQGAGTARAPEPVRLTQDLSGWTGVSASAVYVNSGASTTVVKWPGSWTYNTTLTAGQRCSTVDLAVGQDAVKFIQATGNYRRCV